MSDSNIPACHYDRSLGYRVTSKHADSCDGGPTCAGQRGCQPCDEPHCVVCGNQHATTAQPQACPSCQGKVDDDLTDIQAAYTALAVEAISAGSDGHLVAAAPIPGGDAQVLIGPTVRLNVVLVSKHMRDDHLRGDPLPALAVLAQWEDIYRAYLGHDGQATPPIKARWGQQIIGPRRATISGAIGYLRDQLPYIAQRVDGPDFLAFTRQVRKLRAQLEHALHDEREPELGVECFECGDRLVRRFREPRRCRHSTKARRWVQTLASYGLQIHGEEWRAARMPCAACGPVGQGGIDDPAAGRSWECPGCRKEYDVGEYANAVRRSLLDDDEGSGWCTLQAAADAAADITGRPITAPTIRVWINRGDDIAVACGWQMGARNGLQVVYWPDVLKRATERRTKAARRAS